MAPTQPTQIDCRHANGERHTFEIALSNWLAHPPLDAVLCVAHDVTGQVRTHSRLLARDRIAAVGLLAAGVAHEINNPLAAVVASLELAANRLAAAGRGGIPGPVHAAELAEDIRSAREATDRVRQIVRDLNVFSRSEGESRSVVDIEGLLDTSARIAGNEIRQRARLVRDYGKVPAVYANESRLGQVFLNLLIHAAEATPPGAPDNLIRLSTRRDGQGRILVEVAHGGPGVPPEMRDRMFAPFASLDSAVGGTAVSGLGLAVCQRIVHELGGEITVESNPAGGSLFRVSLPPSGPEGRPRPSSLVDEAPPVRRRGRVLVIDDEPTINSAIARTLSLEHDVATETRAVDALMRLRAGERFDVIFCDLMMPQMTGMDLHRTLSAELPEQAGRMVFLTGGAFTLPARRFLDDVPNLRIEKPFDTRMLRAIVNDRVS